MEDQATIGFSLGGLAGTLIDRSRSTSVGGRCSLYFAVSAAAICDLRHGLASADTTAAASSSGCPCSACSFTFCQMTRPGCAAQAGLCFWHRPGVRSGRTVHRRAVAARTDHAPAIAWVAVVPALGLLLIPLSRPEGWLTESSAVSRAKPVEPLGSPDASLGSNTLSDRAPRSCPLPGGAIKQQCLTAETCFRSGTPVSAGGRAGSADAKFRRPTRSRPPPPAKPRTTVSAAAKHCA
jgi:hypothetical protein